MKSTMLVCHNKVDCLTKGKKYEVIEEDGMGYTIIDNHGHKHTFTKKPDYEGVSYLNFFNEIKQEATKEEAVNFDKWEELKQYIKDKAQYDYASDSGTLQSVLYEMEDLEAREKREERL